MTKFVKDKNTVFYLLLLAFSAVSTYLLTPYYFPSLGLGVFFMALVSMVFSFKKEKNWYQRLLFALTLVLSFFIFYRANPFLTFLNITAVIFLGSLLILDDNKLSLSFFETFRSPFVAFFQSLKVKNIYRLEIGRYLGRNRFNKEKIFTILASVSLASLILIIIVPLLSYANPLFNKLVGDLIGRLNLANLFRIFLGENFPIYLLRSLLFLIFALVIPRILNFAQDPRHKIVFIKFGLPKINWLIPKIAVAFVLAVFFVTQAQLYFADDVTLSALGYSHSQYAREVFGQLSVVSLIIFGLLYADQTKTRGSKIFTYVLLAEATFLNLMALKSVYEYSSAWGFTYKRLYGYAVNAWIFGALAVFADQYRRELLGNKFVKSIVIWSSLVLLAVNLLNFDYLIYHYAKSTTNKGIDHSYLSWLSTDAESYSQHLEVLMQQVEKSEKLDNDYAYPMWVLIDKIYQLKNKYQTIDIRSFNLSEYLEYQKTKNLDLTNYESVLKTKQYL